MKFKIMNHNWEIKKANKLEMNEFTKDTYGVTKFPDREIWILDTLKDDVLKHVVSHELSHAFMDEFGLSNVNTVDPEFVCDFMANHDETIASLTKWVLRNDLNE